MNRGSLQGLRRRENGNHKGSSSHALGRGRDRQLVDWLVHDRDIRGFETWPPTLKKDISLEFGQDPLWVCDDVRTAPSHYLSFRDTLLDRIERKTKLSSQILKQQQWDCFMTVFSDSHCAGHQCWHIHDKTHARHNPEMARETGDPIKDVYIALDQAFGSLLSGVKPHTTVMVLFSHGMKPHCTGVNLLEDMLERLGIANQRYPRLTKALKWTWHQMVPNFLREALLPLNRKVKASLDISTLHSLRTLNSRKSYQIPNNDAWGGVRINLVGREPDGQIQPGADFDSLCDSLIEDLSEFIDLETGKPFINQIIRTDSLYQGPYRDHLPDLLIDWATDKESASIYSPKTGKIEKRYDGCRTGDHRTEGLFMMTGPDIQSGKVEKTVSIMDFAPTIGSLLEVPLPHAQGKSLLPLIDCNTIS